VFKGTEEAEAGNTNRQVVVLSSKTFLLVNATTSDLSTTLVYQVHTCSRLPPVSVNQPACPDRLQDQDREKGCTWTSDKSIFYGAVYGGRISWPSSSEEVKASPCQSGTSEELWKWVSSWLGCDVPKGHTSSAQQQ